MISIRDQLVDLYFYMKKGNNNDKNNLTKISDSTLINYIKCMYDIALVRKEEEGKTERISKKQRDMIVLPQNHEEQLVKYEKEIRLHIKNELEMQIIIEDLVGELNDLEPKMLLTTTISSESENKKKTDLQKVLPNENKNIRKMLLSQERMKQKTDIQQKPQRKTSCKEYVKKNCDEKIHNQTRNMQSIHILAKHNTNISSYYNNFNNNTKFDFSSKYIQKKRNSNYAKYHSDKKSKKSTRNEKGITSRSVCIDREKLNQMETIIAKPSKRFEKSFNTIKRNKSITDLTILSKEKQNQTIGISIDDNTIKSNLNVSQKCSKTKKQQFRNIKHNKHESYIKQISQISICQTNDNTPYPIKSLRK